MEISGGSAVVFAKNPVENQENACSLDTLPAQWERVKSRLAKELGEAAFRNWIKPLTVRAISSQTLEILVPTRFMKDWVYSHYADTIRTLWMAEFPGEITAVEMIVSAQPHSSQKQVKKSDEEKPKATESVAKPTSSITTPSNENTTDVKNFSLDSVSSPLDPRYTFANFVVGKTNELAHAAAKRVVETEGVSFNPLFLYGGVGLGKTHLMHAIAHAIREQSPNRRVLYLSAEKFMYQFIRALRFRDTVSFKEMFRSVDVLMIDDVQFISGKESTQEEFFHTFNALIDQNKQIVISADKSPSDLDGVEDRLKSRLGWGLVADIHPTTYELRLGILQTRLAQMNRAESAQMNRKTSNDVPSDVLEFLAHKITSNVRELEGALNRVVAHADFVGRAVTIDTTHDVLADLLRANDKRLTIDDIQKKVSEHYNIRMTDMHSARRARAVARPRQVAMYLCKKLTPASLPEIGRKFGGRDHTTVIHGVRKVEELMSEDRTLLDDIELLRRALMG